MALPKVGNAQYPTPDEIVNQLLSTWRYGYERIGVTANVSKGSEPYIRAQGLAGIAAIPIANNQLALSDVSPLDAKGDALVQLAGVFGVKKRPASSGAGPGVVSVVTGPLTIPAGFKASAPNGKRYEVASTLTLSDGDFVELSALSTGAGTDQIIGTVLTWEKASIPGLGLNVVVGGDGIRGGADEDDEETLRKRLIERLSNPQAGGNAAQVRLFAQNASAAVEDAFVFQAVRGPSSYDVALTSAGGNRTLSSLTSVTVANAILGQMPGSADLNVTTVAPELVDIVAGVQLPLPVNAGGSGDGWRDARPWPSAIDIFALAQVFDVTNLLTLSQIKVDSTLGDPPYAGARFGIWNPTGGSDSKGAMHEFVAKTVTGGSGNYTITIDTANSDAISFIKTGMYCSAGAVNLKAYALEMRDAVAGLGPGEKTTSADILPRGRRFPTPDVAWPTSLTNALFKKTFDAHEEVVDLLYYGRFAAGTITNKVSPTVPSTTADPPKILVLNNLSFRAIL